MSVHRELDDAVERFASSLRGVDFAHRELAKGCFNNAPTTIGTLAELTEAYVVAGGRAARCGSEVLGVLRRMDAYGGSVGT